MKKFLLSACMAGLSVMAFGQISTNYNFNGGTDHGFNLSQGSKIQEYNNPNVNGCTGGDDDYGIQTPGVGGNNPANFSTPQIIGYNGGAIINYTFQVFVFNANMNCGTNQNFACATKAKAYIVPLGYSSNSAPTGANNLAESNLTLVTAFGTTNNLFFTLTPAQQTLLANTEFRILIDLTADNCNQNGVKYIFDNIRIIETVNTPLPVSLVSFTATRNKNNVAVKWETASESNNKGFNVQRKTDGGWETIAFVFSASTGGNSSEKLAYAFNDANGYKGVSQYRIQQVDLNGMAKMSEIRSVKGEATATKLVVYPNPSTTGKISVVFDDAAPKNVQVSDMSGRVVRNIRSVTNNVNIEGLESGVYSIQVTDLSSSAVTVEKIIIKKR